MKLRADNKDYNNKPDPEEQEICNVLATEICKNLPNAENKIWYAHPVWFLEGNPIVGYSILKNGIRLFSGAVRHLTKPN